jgi:predicted ATPase
VDPGSRVSPDGTEPTPTPIRTPDQRLRVFVSSTLQELADERRAVREAILGLRLTPVMFEEGARAHPPRALYRAYLEQSDVFVGLYWQRYGWIAPGEDVSGLEDEYLRSGTLPKLIYIKAPAPDRDPQLSALIDAMKEDDGSSYRRFEDADELRELIGDDLAVMMTERFAASAGSRLPALGPPVSTVPRPPSRLIGRDEEVEEVTNLLDDPTGRMVTIVGPGGVGKSRLALAVAQATKDRYPDGVRFVDLAAVAEPSLVAGAIAKAVGLGDRPGGDETYLIDMLARARMLIVLDNMEQLTGAAEMLSALLAGSDALRLLVTSRRRLNIRSERVFELEPLALSHDTAAAPAVELFMDRARSIRPRYEPTDGDIAAIDEICRRLDGLPLAIELASARVGVLSPRSILNRIGHRRLPFLTASATDLPSRQRTLRDTIAWSYDLLEADARRLFARLAVFAGGADLDAIERIADPDATSDVLALLGDLVENSLLRVSGDGIEPRFTMLETIREFAVERLEETGDAADDRRRHEVFYLDLAERGSAGLSTARQLDWLDRLTANENNFRAVLRRAIRRDDAEVAVRMGRALSAYWHIHGGYTEGRTWMERAASLPSARTHDRAVAWTIGAVQSFLQGDYEPLEAGLDAALPNMDVEADRQIAAYAEMLRAIAYGAARHDVGAQEALDEATRRLQATGEPLAIGFGLIASAYVALTQGRPVEARERAIAAYDLSARMGEWYVRAYAATQVAAASAELFDWPTARRYSARSLLGGQRLRNVHLESYALEVWARAELGEGRIDRAGRLFALANRGYDETGSGPWRTDAAGHERLATSIRAALGEGFDATLAEARRIDFGQAVAELMASAEHETSDGAPTAIPVERGSKSPV